MRVRRAGLAALLAIFGYLLGTAAAPLLFSKYFESTGTATIAGPVVSLAYAAPANSANNPCTAPSGSQATSTNNQGSTANCPINQTAQGSGSGASSTAAQTGITQTTDGSTGINQDTCAAHSSSFGWVTCPIFDSIAHFISGAAKDLMQQFLQVQPLQISSGSTHYPLYDTWSAIRLLANVLFVLIFLVLIFAHTLRFEVDAYAIKKMIPKLVAGVVLVQFSFVLSAGIVDIGNILGNGMGALIGSITHNGLGASNVGQTLIEDLTSVFAAGALVSLVIVSTPLMAMASGALLITALGFITTLAVRYFLIGLLIVISPLAFAAWVLPNTEAYFNKWLSTFIKLVLMYPIIMVLLSVAGDVGGLLPVTTNGGTTTGITNTIGTSIIKLFVVAACFAAVPATFKWAGGAMGAAYSSISGLTQWGVKSRWNSVSGRSAREKALNKRLDRADKIANGLERKNEGYSILGKIPSKRLRQNLIGVGTGAFAASPGDRSVRQSIRSGLVSNHGKDIESLEEAQDSHNLEAALMHYELGQQANFYQKGSAGRNAIETRRKSYMSSLQAADAVSLTELTGNELWREGMMSVLGKRNSLKPELSGAIQKTRDLAREGNNAVEQRRATHELLAFTRQSFPSYDAQPLVSGLRANVEDRVEPFELKENVGNKLKDLDAGKIKSSFSDRNFQVLSSAGTARELPQAAASAQLFAENVGAGYLRQNFAYKNRNEMSGQKKLHFLLGMARNDQAFSTVNGRAMKSAVVNQILQDLDNPEAAAAHNTMLRELRTTARDEAIAAGQDPAAAEAEILQRLNDIDREAGRGPLTWL